MLAKVTRAVRCYVVIPTIVIDTMWPGLYRGASSVQTHGCRVCMQMLSNSYHGFYKIFKTIRVYQSIMFNTTENQIKFIIGNGIRM